MGELYTYGNLKKLRCQSTWAHENLDFMVPRAES